MSKILPDTGTGDAKIQREPFCIIHPSISWQQFCQRIQQKRNERMQKVMLKRKHMHNVHMLSEVSCAKYYRDHKDVDN
jgi:hypothetical protein